MCKPRLVMCSGRRKRAGVVRFRQLEQQCNVFQPQLSFARRLLFDLMAVPDVARTPLFDLWPA